MQSLFKALNLQRSKKGQMSNILMQLIPIVFILSIAGVFTTLNADLNEDFGADLTSGSVAEGVKNNTDSMLSNVSGKFPSLGTIVINVLILFILLAVAAVFFGRRMVGN